MFRDNLWGPIVKGQESKTVVRVLYSEGCTRVIDFLLGTLTLDDGADRLSRNVGKKLPLLAT